MLLLAEATVGGECLYHVWFDAAAPQGGASIFFITALKDGTGLNQQKHFFSYMSLMRIQLFPYSQSSSSVATTLSLPKENTQDGCMNV